MSECGESDIKGNMVALDVYVVCAVGIGSWTATEHRLYREEVGRFSTSTLELQGCIKTERRRGKPGTDLLDHKANVGSLKMKVLFVRRRRVMLNILK